MQLSNYLGLKLVDIGTDSDTNTLWLEFTGGHQIHIKRDDINRAIILTKPKESYDELEARREEVKKARADARAAKAAKTTTAASQAGAAARKASKKKET